MKTIDGNEAASTLIVLRGNSGSGKTTVAQMVQQHFAPGECLVIAQDEVRRSMLNEPDHAGASNIDLIEAIATWGLDRGVVVLVEGILNARRYASMLERVSARAPRSAFFGWDLSLEETVRRHALRSKRVSFAPKEMAEWYHGWQPLEFVTETRFDATVSAEDATERILGAVVGR